MLRKFAPHAAAALLGAATMFGGVAATSSSATRTVVRSVPVTQTVYVRNLAQQFISDARIRNDIPAWQTAMNKDFAPVWRSTLFKFVFIGRAKAPKGTMTATFVNKGSVQGALAYHTVTNGVPSIVVYAGTAAYYGFDNSVSFTHEAEELAADPMVSVTNQGWPYDFINIIKPDGSLVQVPQLRGTVWAQEVSDPVEVYSYTRPGANGRPVKISDFITPNWFNDQVNGGFDFMNLVHAPFTILPGGYAQYWDGVSWNSVLNFRKGHASDAGFLKGDSQRRH